MKKVLAVLALPFLFACGADTPTQAPMDFQPQFILTAGSGDTWYFMGNVTTGGTGVVSGSVEYIAEGPGSPPLPGNWAATAVFKYAVGGTPYTVDGTGSFLLDEYSGLTITVSDGSTSAQLDLTGDASAFDTELPGPPTTWTSGQLQLGGITANLTALQDTPFGGEPTVTDPTTKDDCKKGGYEDFGFKNQGQCVRFVETGKDSR